jgi:hypothetical protein
MARARMYAQILTKLKLCREHSQLKLLIRCNRDVQDGKVPLQGVKVVKHAAIRHA